MHTHSHASSHVYVCLLVRLPLVGSLWTLCPDRVAVIAVYRKDTHFITGIPYSNVSIDRLPSVTDYFYLMIYLRMKLTRYGNQ